MVIQHSKFKMIFWSIVFLVCAFSGGIGLYKNYSSSVEERERAKYSTKDSSEIIIKGNIPKKSDETSIKNFLTAIFNDSKLFLIEDDKKIILSDKGKVTSTVKVMYLEKNISLTQGIDNKDIDNIVVKSKELFGSYVKFEDFTINYSDENCGTSGFDSSIRSVYGDSSKVASAKCDSPYLIFEPKQIRYDKYTYVVLLNFVYVEENEFDGTTENEFENPTCQENEIVYKHTISAYKDLDKNDKIYTTNLDGCCIENECKTPGIMKIRNSLLSTAENSNSQYYVRFDKVNGIFQLKEIIKK